MSFFDGMFHHKIDRSLRIRLTEDKPYIVYSEAEKAAARAKAEIDRKRRNAEDVKNKAHQEDAAAHIQSHIQRQLAHRRGFSLKKDVGVPHFTHFSHRSFTPTN